MKEMNALDSNLKKSEVEDNTNDNENERSIPNIAQHVYYLCFLLGIKILDTSRDLLWDTRLARN